MQRINLVYQMYIQGFAISLPQLPAANYCLLV